MEFYFNLITKFTIEIIEVSNVFEPFCNFILKIRICQNLKSFIFENTWSTADKILMKFRIQKIKDSQNFKILQFPKKSE